MTFNRWTIALFAAGALVGFFLAVPLCNYKILAFSGEVTFGNIGQIAATVLTGLIVAAFIQWGVQNERKEKELFLAMISTSVLPLLDEVESFKNGGEYTQAVAALKNFRTACRSLVQLLEFVKYPKEIRDRVDFSQQIRRLRNLITNTPIESIERHAQDTSMTTEVRDGILQMASNTRKLIEKEVTELRTDLFRAQIAINRCSPKA